MTTTTPGTERPAGADSTPAYLHRSATAYLDGVAGQLAAVKSRIQDLLEPGPGQRLLDVGCGTGVDVLALADRVAPGGSVSGVDMSGELVAEATGRVPDGVAADFRVADASALPFPDHTFDGTRAERVLQHVPDPGRAIAELVRVTRPGGRVLAADPDHGMWALDMSDRALTRTLMSWWVDNVPNPWMGRQLAGLLRAAGVEDVRIELAPIVLRDLAAADGVVGLGKVATWAREQDVVPAPAAEAWGSELLRRDAEDQFLLCGAIVVAHGRAPGRR